MNKRLFLLTSAAMLMQGCAGALVPLPAGAEHGTPPVDIEAAIKAHFNQTLKDSESARYQFGTPKRAHANWGLIDGGGIRWIGYLVPVQVNAKNSYGGYTGYQPYMALFYGGARGLHKVVPGTSHPTIFID